MQICFPALRLGRWSGYSSFITVSLYLGWGGKRHGLCHGHLVTFLSRGCRRQKFWCRVIQFSWLIAAASEASIDCCVTLAPSCCREPKQEIFRREDGLTCYYMQMKWDSPSSSSFFFCSCLDSPPIRIEYKQPVCNEAGDDSPALPFVGLRLWLPTAFEMCLMCCDA